MAKQQLSKQITGLELSAKMIKLAEQRDATVSYQQGETHAENTFNSEAFDCIISRQVACHFHDPLKVFENWHKCLKNNGYVIIVDGFWRREDWSNHPLIDKLPIFVYSQKQRLLIYYKNLDLKLYKTIFLMRRKRNTF